jgi:hypothetical protein
MRRVKPTMDFVWKIITEDANCDIAKNMSRAYRVNIKIDPLLFRKYGSPGYRPRFTPRTSRTWMRR